MNVFYAHARQDDADDLEREAMQLGRIFPGCDVVLARDDYKARARQEGSWLSWADSVTAPQGWNRTVRFPVIVVPSLVIGRATAQVISPALPRSIDVLFWVPGGRVLRRVVALQTVDSDDWKDGWELSALDETIPATSVIAP